jgi:Ni/Co efflux regulator RcnB
MKRLLLFLLLASCLGGSIVPAQAKTQPHDKYKAPKFTKAEKKQQKAQRKYAKAQQKADRKMIKTSKRNTKYPQHSLGR